MDQEKVSLATVGGGAAIERFDIALQQVINNILDVNTDARKEGFCGLAGKDGA